MWEASNLEHLNELLKRIEDLRGYLEDMIEEKDGVWDSEIIETSKMLDGVLNEYNRVITRNKK